MKKFIFTALVACLYLLCALFPIPSPRASADETPSAVSGSYACVLDDETFFYAAKDEKQGLFLLPKTYFVKVLDAAPDFCRIEYLFDGESVKKLTGYAKTSKLSFVDYTPETPYLHLLFEINYRLDEDAYEVPSSLGSIRVTCAYYGDYKIGSKTYCYILRGEDFGYILKPDDLTYAENPEYARRESEAAADTKAPSAEEEQESGTSPAQIAILIALCLLVPVLAALILKPPKRPPYEEE